MSAEQFLNNQILELREQRAAADARINALEKALQVIADWKFKQVFMSNDICVMSDFARKALDMTRKESAE